MERKTPRAALLLIDVINDMNFVGGEALVTHALPAAEKIAALKRRLRAKGVPVIYVNDNFGQWQSDFNQQIQRCLGADSVGREVVSLLIPDAEDYFILKPKHSGFYSTALEVLLEFLGIDSLIITGFAADICVLYTANDAYMRDYSITVPPDCVAAETDGLKQAALDHIRLRLKATVCQSRYVRC
ncbi:MAG: cysteine hydrolase [Verrucomicrobiaceae bacterium]|nr:MAG: cysteine hydrolase [Verrucomicrobiaceae bacterium]